MCAVQSDSATDREVQSGKQKEETSKQTSRKDRFSEDIVFLFKYIYIFQNCFCFVFL